MLWPLIMYMAIATTFLAIFKECLNGLVLMIAISFLLFYTIPVVIIHWNYYHQSKGKFFVLETSRIILNENNVETFYCLTEIATIEFFMTANEMKQSGLRHFPFEGYHFAKIVLKNGQELLITSLFSNNLGFLITKNLEGIPYLINKRFFPTVE